MQYTANFNLLRAQDILSSLTEDQVSQMAKNSRHEKVLKGEYLYQSGQSADYVYFILDGGVKLGMVSSTDKILIKSLVYSGDICGENIFAGHQQRQGFAEAMETTQYIKVNASVVKQIVQSNGKFAAAVTDVIINRLKNIEQRMQNFVFLKAKARIVDFIKKTGEAKGIKIGIDEILVNHGMSHKEIAYLTDTSRQTVARVLGELKKENYIHFSARKPSKILLRNSFLSL